MTEQEQLSVFDMFKIGVGPSSSHTLGPWRAAHLFLAELERRNVIANVRSIRIELFGSLAKTGKGHGTDIALQLGLCGYDPVTFDVTSITPAIQSIRERHELMLNGSKLVSFNPD